MKRYQIGLMALIPFFFSCSLSRQILEGVLSPPNVHIEHVQVTGLDFSKVSLLLDLMVSNPNTFDVNLEQIQYSFYLEESQTALFSSAVKEAISVTAGDTSSLSFPVDIAFSSIKNMDFKATNMRYRIQGEAKVKTIMGLVKVPVDYSGTFPVPSLPGIHVKKINLSAFSLLKLKATILLVVSIENRNSFALPLKNMNLNLSLNGSPVARQTRPEGVVVSPGTVENLNLMIDLDLSGLADIVKKIMDGKPLAFDLSGQYGLEGDGRPSSFDFSEIGRTILER